MSVSTLVSVFFDRICFYDVVFSSFPMAPKCFCCDHCTLFEYGANQGVHLRHVAASPEQVAADTNQSQYQLM